MTKVLTFGTFDGIHDGHRVMLREAKQLSLRASAKQSSQLENSGLPREYPRSDRPNYLIVAVAPDSVVKEIKGTLPKYSTAQRVTTLKNEHLADEVVVGDDQMHSWKIVKKYKPNIIALGYDQQDLQSALAEHLEKSYPDIETDEGFQNNPKKPKIVMLSAHKPDIYKSSLLK